MVQIVGFVPSLTKNSARGPSAHVSVVHCPQELARHNRAPSSTPWTLLSIAVLLNPSCPQTLWARLLTRLFFCWESFRHGLSSSPYSAQVNRRSTLPNSPRTYPLSSGGPLRRSPSTCRPHHQWSHIFAERVPLALSWLLSPFGLVHSPGSCHLVPLGTLDGIKPVRG